MAYPCWRDWSETSNVLLVKKPIERVVAFCRLEDHLNPATREVDLEVALSGSFHRRLYWRCRDLSGSLAIFAAIRRAAFQARSIIQRQGKSDCAASLALLIAAQAGGRAAPLRLPPAPFQICGVVLTPQSDGYLRAFGSVPQVA